MENQTLYMEEHAIPEIPPLKPSNWLVYSILATICCCLPFGIVGIIFTARVDSLYYNGMYAEAEKAAKKAKTWTLLSFFIGLIYLIAVAIMMLTGNLKAISVFHRSPFL